MPLNCNDVISNLEEERVFGKLSLRSKNAKYLIFSTLYFKLFSLLRLKYMNYLLLSIESGISEEEGCLLLSEGGEEILFSVFQEENNFLEIAIADTGTTNEILSEKFSFVTNIRRLSGIDWEAQWKQCEGYENGLVRFDLCKYGQPDSDAAIFLEAGPGFGDFSHPTTQLVARMMGNHCQNKDVLDVGSGSGILSFAAAALGAKSVIGIDIDPEAVEHAKGNLVHNRFPCMPEFGTPEILPSPNKEKKYLVLMNMIYSEQQIAWESIRHVLASGSEILTSGILEEQRDFYLELTRGLNWNLIEEDKENGWLGFRFTIL